MNEFFFAVTKTRYNTKTGQILFRTHWISFSVPERPRARLRPEERQLRRTEADGNQPRYVLNHGSSIRRLTDRLVLPGNIM